MSYISTCVVAEDGVCVSDVQSWVLERRSLLCSHVRESSVVWRKERVLRMRLERSQLEPRLSIFHVLIYLQIIMTIKALNALTYQFLEN